MPLTLLPLLLLCCYHLSCYLAGYCLQTLQLPLQQLVAAVALSAPPPLLPEVAAGSYLFACCQQLLECPWVSR
jgi:hypothetical protein